MFEKAKEKVKQRKAREEASKKALTEAKQAEGSVGRDVGGTVGVPNGIVLFHYPFSPVARRVVWYLTLRGLQYAECIQPAVLPRPDLNDLGINYRRIPLLSINRSIFADSRLILQKLNSHFPNSSTLPSLLSPTPSTPEAATLTRLLSSWTQDGGVFPRASALIPTSYPVFKDGKFVKDRESLTGRKWSVEALEKGKKEVLVGMKECFEVLEGMFKDGREWVLGTQNPSLGDIEAIWPFHWLIGMKGALPSEFISEKQFPKTYAWVRRFDSVLKEAKSRFPAPVKIKAKDVHSFILSSKYAESATGADENDPLGLREGEEVIVYPVDSGSSHKDHGKLIKLSQEEAVVEVSTKIGEEQIRIHVPRWGFRVARVTDVAVVNPKL